MAQSRTASNMEAEANEGGCRGKREDRGVSTKLERHCMAHIIEQ